MSKQEGLTAGDLKAINERRHRIATWVAREVIPHEARVRTWLGRSRVSPEDVDELIQESYCRLAMLETVEHIDCPDAYFFSIVRNLHVRRLKRQRVVALETIAAIDAYVDDCPSPERLAAGKLDYARMLGFMAALPERCRRVVQLRKIDGWSQKQIAAHLGTTEKAVEKQVWLGVKAIRAAWSQAEQDSVDRLDHFDHFDRVERRRGLGR
jgi:RNA polymerase sigma factor (sigma-70 family)